MWWIPLAIKLLILLISVLVEPEVKNLKKVLRIKAEKYLEKHVSDFAEVKKTYILEQGGKGDPKGDSMYAFRWNAPAKVNDEDMLPYVMVRLTPSGKLLALVIPEVCINRLIL
jgi:hypothetical protein